MGRRYLGLTAASLAGLAASSLAWAEPAGQPAPAPGEWMKIPGVPSMADALAGRAHVTTAIPTPPAGARGASGHRSENSEIPKPKLAATDPEVVRPEDETMTCPQLRAEGELLQKQVQRQQTEGYAAASSSLAHATDGVDRQANYAAHRAAGIASLIPLPGVAQAAGQALAVYTAASKKKAEPAMKKSMAEASDAVRANAQSTELLRFDHLAKLYVAKHCG